MAPQQRKLWQFAPGLQDFVCWARSSEEPDRKHCACDPMAKQISVVRLLNVASMQAGIHAMRSRILSRSALLLLPRFGSSCRHPRALSTNALSLLRVLMPCDAYGRDICKCLFWLYIFALCKWKCAIRPFDFVNACPQPCRRMASMSVRWVLQTLHKWNL